MAKPEETIVQHLDEAHAGELALVQTLAAHIAMTPGGSYRTALERHLLETRDHAQRIERRLTELGESRGVIRRGRGLVQTVVGQAVAVSKAPLDLVRRRSREEKLLENAKDECATEGLEIATYTALERLARAVGDDTTAELAADVRADEERMLETLLGQIPLLANRVVQARANGEPSDEIAPAGAAREARRGARHTARTTQGRVRSATRTAHTAPRVTRAEARVEGAAASEEDLPIAGYSGLTADEVIARLPQLSQADLATIATYEHATQGRTSVLERISALRGAVSRS